MNFKVTRGKIKYFITISPDTKRLDSGEMLDDYVQYPVIRINLSEYMHIKEDHRVIWGRPTHIVIEPRYVLLFPTPDKIYFIHTQ